MSGFFYLLPLQFWYNFNLTHIKDIHNSAIYGYDEKYSRKKSGFNANARTCPQVAYSDG